MGAGHTDEKRLELKVGAMILSALAILVVFLLIVSEIQFGNTKDLVIYFQNPGGLSPGVAVKVAGRNVGKVTEMTFVGQNGPVNPLTGRPSLVRVRMEIEEGAFRSMREDARFYITTKGVLGDPFLEIDPGVSRKSIDATQKLFGTDPPRLDLFLADAAELVRALNRLLVTNADNLDQLIKGSAGLVTAADAFVNAPDEEGDGGHGSRITRIMENVEQLTLDAQVLLKNVNDKYVDNPSIDQTLRNMQSISGKLDREIQPLITDIRETMEVLNRVGNTIGPEEQKSIRQSLQKLQDIAQRADATVARLDRMVTRIENGEGTVGQMLSDEEIYDDLKELLRDIKQHPWKLTWEE